MNVTLQQLNFNDSFDLFMEDARFDSEAVQTYIEN